MCLAILGQLIKITSQMDETFRIDSIAIVGVIKEVSLTLVPEARVKDYVLVHVGAAISIIDEEEANKTLEYLKQIGDLDELNTRQG